MLPLATRVTVTSTLSEACSRHSAPCATICSSSPSVVTQIAAEMERQGMTRYALAKAAGMPAATLGRILSGERPDPQLSTLERLADALGWKVGLTK